MIVFLISLIKSIFLILIWRDKEDVKNSMTIYMNSWIYRL